MTEAFYAAETSSPSFESASHDSVVAIKYVAVSVVKQGGSGVYSYVFHLRTESGAIYSLGARYTVFRRLSSLLLAERPEACTNLPPFPPKHSMSRQTPEFLLARGKALEAYLSAALGNPALSSLPAVRELLRAAELYKPSGSKTAAPVQRPAEGSGSPAGGGGAAARAAARAADLRGMQRESVKMRSIAARSNATALSSGSAAAAATAIEAAATPRTGSIVRSSHRGAAIVVDWAMHPVFALLCALVVGSYSAGATLCVGSCAIGLAAGRVCRALGLSPMGVGSSAGANGNGNGNGNGHAERKQLPAPPSSVAPTAAVAATAEGASNGGLRQRRRGEEPGEPGLTDLDRQAVREAAAAIEVLAEAKSSHMDPSTGWRHFVTREGVEVYMSSHSDGATWVLGKGDLAHAPPDIVNAMEDEANQATLDKQLLSSTVLRVLPPSACQIDGWEVQSLELLQSLYRSPAWPVAPRESCVVKMKARRAADGALIQVQRSVDVPGVVPPAGYTRVTLDCGGYECAPTGGGGGRTSHMTYINILNLNGSIPKVVVNKTAPDRALTIARLRGCLDKAR